jgi:hypothetical protein
MRELRHGVQYTPSMPSDYGASEDECGLVSGMTSTEHRPRASHS